VIQLEYVAWHECFRKRRVSYIFKKKVRLFGLTFFFLQRQAKVAEEGFGLFASVGSGYDGDCQ